ncbi:MAG: Lrp/AsnC ligand binding domain-containing protein [Candidatus Nealsonbacteria bacterium]|nr:Lrp/AsnC ligand binding domain-containing protein [Candidatus Nealsonbacteria bacterium]
MPIGFVLLTVRLGQEKEIFKKLVKIPEILETNPVLGECDFLLKIKGKNRKEMSKMIMEKIKSIKGTRLAEFLPSKKYREGK